MILLNKQTNVLKVFIGAVLSACLFTGQIIMPVSAATKELPSGINYSDIEKTFDIYYEENQTQTAGAAIAIFDRQGMVFEKCYGYSDIKNKNAVDRDTVFDWGSVTKTTIWVSVMQLKEQGKIDLNADIQKYLPTNFFSGLSYDTPITMNMLMNHTAGWQECLELWINNKGNITPLGDALQEVEPEQIFKPQTVQAYSNYGAAVAGYVVECISGMPFDEYVNNHIFKPLGMNHTSISPTFKDNPMAGKKRLELKCYSTNNELLGNGFSYLSLYPAGSIVGTIEDFAIYGRAFLPKEGITTPLFKFNSTLDEMLTPSYYLYGTDEEACYHGLFMLNGKNQIYFHNGGTNGCTSFLGFDPVSGVGYAVLTNQFDNSLYASDSIPMVFGTPDDKTSHRRADMSAKASQDEIDGVYLDTRTIRKGHFKLYSVLFSLLRIKPAENGDLVLKSLLLPFGETILYRTGENTYSFENMSGVAITAYKNANKTMCIHIPSNDYIKVNSTSGYLQVLLAYLLFFSVLSAGLSLLVGLVRFLINRFKKRKLALSPVGIGKTVVYLAVIFTIINVLYEFNDLYAASARHFILPRICGLISLAYTLLLILYLKKLKCTKKQKISYLFAAMIGLFLTINIGYWELYKFW